LCVESWHFLTNHARVLVCIAANPGVRLREVAAGMGITERSAHAMVADLIAAGYVVKHKLGRRNRYQIQVHLPLPEPASQEPAIGDVLALLLGKHEAEGGTDSHRGHERQRDGSPRWQSVSDSQAEHEQDSQPARDALAAPQSNPHDDGRGELAEEIDVRGHLGGHAVEGLPSTPNRAI
jgi:IclR helix-turn-helix domain